jgi:RNA polymerase sigma factor (sigma-70 family)
VAASDSQLGLAELRAETAWLRRLAGALTGDDASADDAVQETWLAQQAHPHPGQGPLGAWLRVVLRNVVRKRARADGRRSAREQAASLPEAAPDAETLATRLEAQRLVARLVLALAEPYRSTVLLCYYEGLAPSEIALREGLPAGTVRWRLKHALDELRARLDAAYERPARWRPMLAPLLPWWRRRSLWKGLMTAKTMSKAGAAALLLLAALLGGQRVWRDRAREAAPATTDGVAAVPGNAVAGHPPPRSLGKYRRGARTMIPRFVTAPSPGAAPPRFNTPPARLEPVGSSLPRNRLPETPPNFKEMQVQVHARLEEFHARADRCLQGWSAPDPALAKGVMLAIELDPDGLQSVGIEDMVDVPSGPLSCLSDAVYGLDWSGIVDRPMKLTTKERYAADPDGGV